MKLLATYQGVHSVLEFTAGANLRYLHHVQFSFASFWKYKKTYFHLFFNERLSNKRMKNEGICYKKAVQEVCYKGCAIRGVL